MSGASERPTALGPVATALRIGAITAVAVIGAGLAWAILDGRPARAGAQVLELLSGGGPDALIAWGLLLMTLVPIVALGVAVATFAAAGERRALRDASIVLALILGSVLIAMAFAASDADATGPSVDGTDAVGDTRPARGGVPLTGVIVMTAARGRPGDTDPSPAGRERPSAS